MIKVNLVRHTPDPEKTVALAARLCYSPIGVEALNEKMSDADAEKLVKKTCCIRSCFNI